MVVVGLSSPTAPSVQAQKPISLPFIKQVHHLKPKPLPKPVPVPATPPPTPAPPPPPVPVPTPPPTPPTPVTGCGSDPYMAVIYQKESGCNTGAYNPGGCRGLGQACPGSKLSCSDYDWNCQDNWFRNYAVQAYGSIYSAYLFRISHNWW